MGSLKSLSVIWPAGIEDLRDSLTQEGFHCELGSQKPEWSKLQKPISLEKLVISDAPLAESYAYLKSGAQATRIRLPSLGLIIADLKLKGSISESLPVLWSDYPEAAMDFVLKKASLPDWAGESMPVPAGVKAEASVHIGPDCKIGSGSILESHVRIGARVSIGKNCRIGTGSRIHDDTIIGDDCFIAGLAAIGGSGFGTIQYPRSDVQQMRFHIGRVVIGDRVRLGSHVSIDRGVFDDTIIGDDCLFDNHVQIGHNCIIGRNAIFCSFVGLSGSTQVGDHTVLAGMVGTAGHLKIGSRVVVAAQSGISKDIPDGANVKGYPPKPLREAIKIQTLIGKLPEFFDRLKKLEKSEESK